MKLIDVVKELETIKSFKSINADFKKSENIFNIYCQVTVPKEEAESRFNKIDKVDYHFCNFNVFQFWFSNEDVEIVIQQLKEVF